LRKKEALPFHDGREQVSVVQQRSQSTRLTTTGRDRGTLKTTDDASSFDVREMMHDLTVGVVGKAAHSQQVTAMEPPPPQRLVYVCTPQFTLQRSTQWEDINHGRPTGVSVVIPDSAKHVSSQATALAADQHRAPTSLHNSVSLRDHVAAAVSSSKR